MVEVFKYYLGICLVCLATCLLGQKESTGLQVHTPKAIDGYTLISGFGSTETYLLDSKGAVAHSWKSERPVATGYYLSEKGELIRTCRKAGSKIGNDNAKGGLLEAKRQKRKGKNKMQGGYQFLEKWSWDNELLWSYEFKEKDILPHHDIELMPNGNLLVTFWEKISMETSLANGKLDSMPTFSTLIRELKPIGKNEMEIVWEWRLWNHIIQEIDANKPNYGIIKAHPERMDINYKLLNSAGLPINFGPNLFHVNSIAYNASLDQIMLSSRNKSEIYIIDHSTTTEEAATNLGGKSGKGGNILFRYGNPSVYQQGSLENRTLFTQHDAQWIPDGHPLAGNILLFNNGYLRPIPVPELYSEILVIENIVNKRGKYKLNKSNAFRKPKILFQYQSSTDNQFYSRAMSGTQALPNGNYLIASARKSRVLEITPQKEIVHDYIIPLKGNQLVDNLNDLPYWGIFKIRRYPKDFIGFKQRDLSNRVNLASFYQSKFAKHNTKTMK